MALDNIFFWGGGQRTNLGEHAVTPRRLRDYIYLVYTYGQLDMSAAAAAWVSSPTLSSPWQREADALLLPAQQRHDLPGQQEIRSQVTAVYVEFLRTTRKNISLCNPESQRYGLLGTCNFADIQGAAKKSNPLSYFSNF